MNNLMRAAAAAALLSLAATPAGAQSFNTSSNGSYGQIQLRAGFTPDPHNVTLNAGGSYDAAQLRDGCGGFIATRASFTLRYRAGGAPLYVGAYADGDTTIVVRAPDGQWYCDDDSAGNLNPVVSFANPASGRYQIWVGRFGVQNETIGAVLHISEIGGPAAPEQQQASGEQPDYTLDPNYGTADLVAGFTPDPHTQQVAAGGSLDASSLGGTCVGWISRAPDYRVNWTAGSSGRPLIFSVQSEADTTLVINDAESNWVCDDDGGNEGLNPSISFANPVSGQYDVWVGTYTQGDLQDSTLNVSELYSR